MVTYDELKTKIQTLKRDVLKYQIVQAVQRRYDITNSTFDKIKYMIQQLNNLIDTKVKELSIGLMLEHYLSSSVNNVGLKSIGFNYSDQALMNRTGLDGNTYQVPAFPQIQLTPSEIEDLRANEKNLAEELRKILCLLRFKVSDKDRITEEPNEEDSMFVYYYSTNAWTFEAKSFNYDGLYGEIKILEWFYQTIDPSLGPMYELKLNNIIADSYEFVFELTVDGSYNVITITVHDHPTLVLSDPSSPDKIRKTTALYVVNVSNPHNITGEVLINNYPIPLKEKKCCLYLIGAEIHGLRGLEMIAEKEIS